MKCLKYSVLFLCLFCLLNLHLQAQVPQVGNKLDFAGMELHLTEQARRDIQSSVDALFRSEKHFNIMLEKVDLYMPLIEPIFAELGVPDEFKYLVIQESALVPDAISSSNAVGFWQFKESSATELNMRVDRQIDERMNIVSATTGAARYLLRSNVEFDNWLYTLQSYMMGQGGTSRSVDKRHYGAREMKIDGDTHWYVKKFLSHMVAFENAIGRQKRNIVLYQYNNSANKSLANIADEFGADEEQLASYNKWLKISQIPDDRIYAVVVPLNIDESEDLLADYEPEEEEKPETGKREKRQPAKGYYPPASAGLGIVEFNNKEGLVAREGDSVSKLADKGGISERRFRKYNDLEPGDKILPGQFYYLEKKYRKARVHEHVLQPGENLWEISQRYGIRLKKLKQKNRLRKNEQLKPGRVLWLRYIRPSRVAVEYREVREPKNNVYAASQPKTGGVSENNAQEQVPVAGNHPADKTGASEPVTEPVQKKKADLPEEVRSKAVEIKEEERIIPYPAEALYPADTPVPEQKQPQQNFGKEILLIQKDTVSVQPSESKVQDKTEQNAPLLEGESLFTEFDQEEENLLNHPEENNAPPENEPEAVAEEEEGFSVDGPVNFVDNDPAEAAAPKDSVHQVQAGETLYSLSRKYNVSVQEIIRWNKLPASPVISIGQYLLVSAPASEVSPPKEAAAPGAAPEAEEEQEASPEKENYKYHTVSAGESMYRVARMYNVTIKDIMQWNNKENFDLREGEELIVGKAQD